MMVQLIPKGWNQRGSERSSALSRPSIGLSRPSLALSRSSDAYSSFDEDSGEEETKKGRVSSRPDEIVLGKGDDFDDYYGEDGASMGNKKKPKVSNDDSVAPAYKRTISTTYPKQTYYELARKMKEEITVKDRKPTAKRTSIMITKSTPKTYKQCFLGSEAVEFIKGYLDLDSREKAIEVGREMNDRIHCWESVNGDYELKDESSSFFRFTDTSKSQEAQLKGLMKSRRAEATETSSVNSPINLQDNLSVDTTKQKDEESILDTPQKKEIQEDDSESRRTRGSRKMIRSQSPRKEKPSNTSSRKARSLSPRRDDFPNTPRKLERERSSGERPSKPRVPRKDRSKSPLRRGTSGDMDKKTNDRRKHSDPKVSKSVQERSASHRGNRAMRKTISMSDEGSPSRSHQSTEKDYLNLEEAHASWGIESEEYTIMSEPTETKKERKASLGISALASLETRAGASVVNSLGKAADTKEEDKKKGNASSNEVTQQPRPSLSKERPSLAKDSRKASLGVSAMASLDTRAGGSVSNSLDRARSASPPPPVTSHSKKTSRLASLYSKTGM